MREVGSRNRNRIVKATIKLDPDPDGQTGSGSASLVLPKEGGD